MLRRSKYLKKKKRKSLKKRRGVGGKFSNNGRGFFKLRKVTERARKAWIRRGEKEKEKKKGLQEVSKGGINEEKSSLPRWRREEWRKIWRWEGKRSRLHLDQKVESLEGSLI